MNRAGYLILIMIFAFCISILELKAQKSNTLYFLEGHSAASSLNPAFSPKNQFVLGLPFLSGVNIGFNNDFRLKNITQKGHGIISDTLRFNFSTFYNSIQDRSRVCFEADFNMFYFGMSVKKNFFSLSVNEKAFFKGHFDKQFIEYFLNGVKPYYGNNSNLGGLSFSIGQYREYGFNFTRHSNKKLSYGVRLKILFGRLFMESGGFQFSLRTASAENRIYLKPSGELNISGPVTFETDPKDGAVRLKSDLQTSDYFFNFSNLGVATDFGFNYKYNNLLSFSASITDLGFLRFSKKNYKMVAENELVYEKLEMTQATNPEGPDYLSPNNSFYAFRDSIPYMSSSGQIQGGMIRQLPVNIYLGSKYIVDRSWTLGFVSRLSFLNDFFYSNFTVSAQTWLNKKFQLTITNSVIRNSIINPGVGCIYKSEILHMYFTADNIIAVVVPSSVKNLNLQFGINLLIEN